VRKFTFKELSEFAKKNRKALKPAEQWLNEFDGNIDDAWNVARNSTHIDWRKIVLVVEWTLDGGVECLLNTILSGRYTTREHPNIYLIRNALEEGRKAVADEKLKNNLASTDQNAAPAKHWGIKRITGWIFRKASHFILTVIVAIFVAVIAAIAVDIFADFGWLQSIKAFIYSILRLK
jgi:hypothetical protein